MVIGVILQLSSIVTESTRLVLVQVTTCAHTSLDKEGDWAETSILFHARWLTAVAFLPQILLQRRGLKLNPITSLYYISPACFGFLLLPFFMFELPKVTCDWRWSIQLGVVLHLPMRPFCKVSPIALQIRNDPSVVINPAVLISNAAAAFGACSLATC